MFPFGFWPNESEKAAAAELAAYSAGVEFGRRGGAIYTTSGAQGAISLPEEHLRTMLSNSGTFQALCGVTTAEAALTRIYRDGLPMPADGREHTIDELADLRPYALVFLGDRNGLALEGGPSSGFIGSGRACIVLERTCPDALGDEPTSEANRDWKNIVGLVLYDLCDLTRSQRPGYLMLTRVELVLGPFWPKPEDAVAQGLFQGAVLEVRWRGV